MTLMIGQRWRYKDGEFDFLVEISQIEPQFKTRILQANKWSTDRGYFVGCESSGGGYGLTETRYHGNVWVYLEGQDKPK